MRLPTGPSFMTFQAREGSSLCAGETGARPAGLPGNLHWAGRLAPTVQTHDSRVP
jgi:hypothetical protein